MFEFCDDKSIETDYGLIDEYNSKDVLGLYLIMGQRQFIERCRFS